MKYAGGATAIGAIIDAEAAAVEVTDLVRGGVRRSRSVDLPPEAETIRAGVQEFVERVRGQGMRVNHQSPRGTIKERQNELRPLLEQVATQAYQLALTREQVLAALDPLLKERGNE